MIVRAAAPWPARNGLAQRFYRYGGAGTDTLTADWDLPEPSPPGPETQAARVLGALAELGGEGTAAEVARVLRAAGEEPSAPRGAGLVLDRLANRRVPAVARCGDAGRGRAQRWRLCGPAAEDAGGEA